MISPLLLMYHPEIKSGRKEIGNSKRVWEIDRCHPSQFSYTCLLFGGSLNVCHLACVWPIFLNLSRIPNIDNAFPRDGFISFLGEIKFRLISSRHFCISLWVDFLNAVYFRRSLTCTLGLTNDLIDSGQPRAKTGF